MHSFRALIIKFVMCAAVLWIILGLYGFSFGNIVTTAVLLTGVSFIVGDLFILPRFGNTAATIADFILTFGMVWLLGAYLFGYTGPLGYVSFITAAVIAIGEALFHRYMEKAVLDDMTTQRIDTDLQRMQTEFGDEPDFKKDRDGRSRREGRDRDGNDDKTELTREKDDFYNK